MSAGPPRRSKHRVRSPAGSPPATMPPVPPWAAIAGGSSRPEQWQPSALSRSQPGVRLPILLGGGEIEVEFSLVRAKRHEVSSRRSGGDLLRQLGHGLARRSPGLERRRRASRRPGRTPIPMPKHREYAGPTARVPHGRPPQPAQPRATIYGRTSIETSSRPRL